MKQIGNGPTLPSCAADRGKAFHRLRGKKPAADREIVRVAELS